MKYGIGRGESVSEIRDPLAIYNDSNKIDDVRRTACPSDGWAIGIATSHDLETWKVVGEILPAAEYEKNGMCVPCAFVVDGSENFI